MLALISFNLSAADCADSESFDLVLVVDSSASIPLSTLNQMKNASSEFVDLFDNETQKVRLVKFN